MDIGALSFSMKQDQLSQQVSISVTKLAMDTTNENYGSMIKMMEQSVNPNLGSTIDFRA